MKLVIDEKLKHRLVGVAVVLSLGAIFLPAMMKKSSKRLENNFSVKVQLPPKPATPNVAITDEKEMFKTIKVARIEIPSTVEQKKSSPGQEDLIQSVQVAHNEAVSVAKVEASKADTVAKPIELALSNAAQNVVKKQVKVAAVTVPAKPVKVSKPVAKVSPKTIKKPVIAQVNTNINSKNYKRNMYAVQLASFSKLDNAQSLVSKLRGKGYKASYIKTAGRQGPVYKVYAGHSPVKSDVMKLKIQLASAMQLNGFIVNTGVS
ncbi:SPOR domain-containing protein [Legionella parisiensis]|uniref:Cell division protein DedD n=1 Tax=Legionella parisiensis TaxID=45071 RepID=A0A1E5JQS4_9GAMM|nr:SPOR domain-containing protein [Legionella parisiensis]KTD41549.1 Sporulation domain-containing protein [Legionella parisiensis]OEH46874.1 Cell division protein DedD [Legionella parisiensis]STX76133.1 Sporulation domain-containing protein [Legionella parisiensis]